MFIVKLGLFVEFTLSDLRPLSYIFQWTARRHEQSSGQGQAYGSARLDTVLWSTTVTEACLQCPSQDRHLHEFPKKINTKKANTDTIKLDGKDQLIYVFVTYLLKFKIISFMIHFEFCGKGVPHIDPLNSCMLEPIWKPVWQFEDVFGWRKPLLTENQGCPVS